MVLLYLRGGDSCNISDCDKQIQTPPASIGTLAESKFEQMDIDKEISIFDDNSFDG